MRLEKIFPSFILVLTLSLLAVIIQGCTRGNANPTPVSVKELTVESPPPVLLSGMDYANQAKGCGDIFVYNSNHASSEFALVSIDDSTAKSR